MNVQILFDRVNDEANFKAMHNQKVEVMKIEEWLEI